MACELYWTLFISLLYCNMLTAAHAESNKAVTGDTGFFIIGIPVIAVCCVCTWSIIPAVVIALCKHKPLKQDSESCNKDDDTSNDDDDDSVHSEGLDPTYEDPEKVEKSAPPNACKNSDEITAKNETINTIYENVGSTSIKEVQQPSDHLTVPETATYQDPSTIQRERAPTGEIYTRPRKRSEISMNKHEHVSHGQSDEDSEYCPPLPERKFESANDLV